MLPGGAEFDGSINFACDQDDEIIFIGQEVMLLGDVVIDGANAAGSGKQITLRNLQRQQCDFVEHRLFMIEDSARVTLRNLAVQEFFTGHSYVGTAFDGGGSSDQNGAAIYNRGELTLENVSFAGNKSGFVGGAIFSVGDLTIRDSLFGGVVEDVHECTPLPFPVPDDYSIPNEARRGGAIGLGDRSVGENQTLIERTHFSYSGASEHGDEIYAAAENGGVIDVVVRDSRFDGFSFFGGYKPIFAAAPTVSMRFANTWFEGYGELGFSAINSFGARITLDRSAITSFSVFNGAIKSATWPVPPDSTPSTSIGGEVTIVNSTITNNRTVFENDSHKGVAGVLALDYSGNADPKPKITLINSTIARNISEQYGRPSSLDGLPTRGINVASDGGVVQIKNSLIAEAMIEDENGLRMADGSSGDANCGLSGYYVTNQPDIVTDGVNLDSDGSCIAASSNPAAFVDGQATQAGIESVADLNGGSTLSLALLAGSAAIDVAENSICADVSTVANLDQRNVQRLSKGGLEGQCDVGAFEFVPTSPPTPSPSPSPLPPPTASPVPTPTPLATVSPSPLPSPTASPIPAPTPLATVSPSPVASSSPDNTSQSLASSSGGSGALS